MSDTIGLRRARVLAAARKAYQTLKRRRLVMDVSIVPDRSPQIVAVLAIYAFSMHAYLKREEARECSEKRKAAKKPRRPRLG